MNRSELLIEVQAAASEWLSGKLSMRDAQSIIDDLKGAYYELNRE
ncbi:hypothetical protein NVP1061O_22 [Vibrio phage 1.061.O._10N.286.55.C2]|nr:hypothetical protein NVP1061O_22 [Vibrio phage 1.061.O._10N.286.55.C2]